MHKRVLRKRKKKVATINLKKKEKSDKMVGFEPGPPAW